MTTNESQPASGLSPRQAEALALMAAGLCRKEIAYRLGVSGNTLTEHIKAARSKLQARTTTHAVVLYDRATRGGA